MRVPTATSLAIIASVLALTGGCWAPPSGAFRSVAPMSGQPTYEFVIGTAGWENRDPGTTREAYRLDCLRRWLDESGHRGESYEIVSREAIHNPTVFETYSLHYIVTIPSKEGTP